MFSPKLKVSPPKSKVYPPNINVSPPPLAERSPVFVIFQLNMQWYVVQFAPSILWTFIGKVASKFFFVAEKLFY